jgi:hypothetical protein
MEKRQPSNKWVKDWRVLVGFVLAASIASAADLPTLSRADAMRIGRKIWQNECNGTVSGLTSWNAGENFASLGIGHFIWYPADGRGPFEESFPKFRQFAINEHANVPTWLREAAACPWNSRAEFLGEENSPRMKELRAFLVRTVDLQARFMVARLQGALMKMLDQAAPSDRENVQAQFQRVAASPNGAYALVDYVNFKGEGTLPTERYHGKGWGLLQVLEGMHGTTTGPVALQEFSRSAAEVLKQRVANSPPERRESRWLPGWLNRVKSYRANS